MGKMGWTGERYIPGMEEGMIHCEHLHRYRFAKEFIKDKRGLDLGCGEGYGSFMLSEEAEEIIGIDIDEVIIRHASTKYIRENLRFIRGSITDIPIKGEKGFDVITCFETIEHIVDHHKLMKEVKGLIKDEGIFIISSPNKYLYADKPNFRNPFHFNELYFDEFRSLLNEYFRNTFIYGHNAFASSNIFPLFEGTTSTSDFAIKKHKNSFLFVPSEMKEAQYFIAVSSDAPVKDLKGNSYLADISETSLKKSDSYVKNLEALNLEKEAALNKIYNSRGWKVLSKYYRIRERAFRKSSRRWRLTKLILRLPQIINLSNIVEGFYCFKDYGLQTFIEKVSNRLDKIIYTEDLYQLWVEKNEPKEKELEKQRNQKFNYEPKISIITPTFNTPGQFLTDLINSILGQTYSNWELCVVDGGSQKGHVKDILKTFSDKENRIKVKFLPENKGITGNSNEALSLATGDLITFLDHDDTLSPFSFYEVIKAINENPDADFIYSDEDKISENGERRFDPHFKPDWSPDTLRSYNYITHLTVIKRELLDRIGWFRGEYEGGQDYDLILRATEQSGKIIHIPKILYHWRISRKSAAGNAHAKLYAYESAKKALRDHVSRIGLVGEVEKGLFLGSYKIAYPIGLSSKISIIIPNKDQAGSLKRSVMSIINRSTYKNIDILIVENGSVETGTFKLYDELGKWENIRVIEWKRPFNYSAINNFAVSYAKTEVILFLNNDTEVINPDWLERMLEHVLRGKVGAVGAKLYFDNDEIQHAGVVIGLGGVAGHPYRYFPKYSSGYMNRLKVIHNLSAVTGASLMTKRSVFEQVGGFDEKLAFAFNDIDLCLKMREEGYLVVWTPYAELYHHESKTRGYEDTPDKQERFRHEIEYFRSKWKHVLEKGDPYYNPNLALDKEDFSIRI